MDHDVSRQDSSCLENSILMSSEGEKTQETEEFVMEDKLLVNIVLLTLVSTK